MPNGDELTPDDLPDFDDLEPLESNDVFGKDDEEVTLIGDQFLHGLSGRSQDALRAAAQYRVAAENGYAPAVVRLALLYIEGEGVGRSAAEARKFLLQAIALLPPAGEAS